MKRVVLFIGVILLFAGVVTASGTKFIFTLHGNYLNVADNTFTSQTGKKKIYAEGKAAVTIYENLYVWGSYGLAPIHDTLSQWSSKATFDADISVARVLEKRVISGGVGFFIGYLEPQEVSLMAELGVCDITNVIDSTFSNVNTSAVIRTEAARQTGLGFRGSLGVTYGLFKNLFAEISIGYMYSADTIDSVRSKLGGLHYAIGLGIRL
jgi:hypothetical protein